MQNSTNKSLFDLLVTRNFEVELLSIDGKPVADPEDARIFSFEFVTPNKNYGTVVVLLSTEQEMQVFFGDNVGRTMEKNDKQTWYKFLAQLKNFALRNMYKFDLKNLNRLKYSMQGMAAIKEGLFEGYYGSRKTSYNNPTSKTRLIIKHNKSLGEGEARYRNIESLYVEAEDGSRFKLPHKNLMLGKVMARHCSEGGNPYDAFGQYINNVVVEMNTLASFVRATKNKKYDEETKGLVEVAVKHYRDLKQKAKRMISKRGYKEEIEAYDPSLITNSEETVDAIREMFIEKSVDPRIEQALPMLANIQEQERMRQVDVFEQWADQLVEGTWDLPDSKEEMRELKKLLSEPLPVGPDGENATGQLYNLVGDDELFDDISELAETDPNADCRNLVLNRLKELGIDLYSGEQTDEDLDTDGIMMTRPSNMSS